MTYAIILCGGVGTRIKNSTIPKQFILINDKPIVIHTIEKFLMNINVDTIIVPCHKSWTKHLQQYISKYLKDIKKNIYVVSGGNSRNESIKSGVFFIKNNLNPNDNDVIITHDSVRMFVSNRIINDNINKAKEHNAIVDTCVKTIDTIVISYDGENIIDIPNRNFYYNGQTPQTGKFSLISKIYSKEDYDKLVYDSTDLCKLAQLNNINIINVEGDYYNFKITTDFDLKLAKVLIK